MNSNDSIVWIAALEVAKYAPEVVKEIGPRLDRSEALRPQFDKLGVVPDVLTIDPPANILTTVALGRIAGMIIGEAGMTAAPWSSSYIRMGVGSGATAATAGDTDLAGAQTAAGRYWMTLDASYPTRTNAVLTYRATFADTVANFAWNEWGLDLVTAGSPQPGTGASTMLLNRKVASLGTKASGAIWIASATFTLASS